MHEIEMNEASEEFVRCWQAAGTHIENQAQGDFQGWLRGHLAPPFLEHLSFRLGNQLFFIRLLDKDNLLETPGSMKGLLYISSECKGYACVMRMEKRKGDWIPVDQGWGLLDAVSKSPVNPPALISDKTVPMTDWEVQDFAVQIVRDSLKKDGYELLSWNGNPEVNPSIWFVGESGPEWIVVRPSRGLHGAFKVIANMKELEEHY